MQNIANKVALITGGSKGIGLGIAQSLLQSDVKVVITARSQESLDKGLDELGKSDNLLGVVSDVRSYESQQAAVQSTLDKFGQLDFLIANAGIGKFASIEDLSLEDWNNVIDTNLTGAFYTVKAGLEALKASKGYYITISSLAGTNFFPTASAYNASKFGLTGFTQAVMLDLRKHGIKTTTIMPGSVSTQFNDHTPGEADSWKIQIEDLGQMVVDLLRMHHRTLPSKIEVRPTVPPSAK